MRGRVKWFNNAKGFGFVEQSGKEDIFIHYSNIINDGYKTPKEGDEVEFDLEETDKGYQATNIRLIKELITIE